MLKTVVAAQVPVLVVILLLGAVAKVATARTGDEPGGPARLGPAALVPRRLRAPVMYLCAAGELLMAGGLAVTAHPLFRWCSALFFSLATYVLLELRRRRPDVGCGCFGEVSARPIGPRTIGRTVLLAAMSAGAVWTPTSAAEVLGGLSWGTAGAMAAGVLALAAMSPELEEAVARLRHRAPCERRAVAPGRALSRLRASSAWRAHARLLAEKEPEDTWRELCWRFFVYPGRTPQGEAVRVVFAVYLDGRRPSVRAAVVDEDGAAVPSVPVSVPVSAPC